MIWELFALVFGFAALMLYQALERVSPISAGIALIAWGYAAVLGGSIEYVTDSGVQMVLPYESLTIFCILLCVASVLVALWAFSEDTEQAVPGETAVSGGR